MAVETSGSSVVYAGFWRRAGGVFVDGVLYQMFAFVVLGRAAFEPEPALAESGPLAGLQLFLLLLGPLLYDVVLTSRFGWTLGKRAVGVEVRDGHGRLLSIGRATGRYFARILSWLPLGLGYLWAAWDDRKQTFHDKIVGSFVIHTGNVRFAPGASGEEASADGDVNLMAVSRARLPADEDRWLREVARQVGPRLDRVGPDWYASGQAEAARATAFGLLLGHLAGRYPQARPHLSRVAEAHPSYGTLLAGSRLDTLEQIAEDRGRMTAWLGPLVGVDEPAAVARLLDDD